MRTFLEQTAEGEGFIFIPFGRAAHQSGPAVDAQDPEADRQDEQADAQHDPEPDRYAVEEAFHAKGKVPHEGRYVAIVEIIEVEIVLKTRVIVEDISSAAAGLRAETGKNAK